MVEKILKFEFKIIAKNKDWLEPAIENVREAILELEQKINSFNMIRLHITEEEG